MAKYYRGSCRLQNTTDTYVQIKRDIWFCCHNFHGNKDNGKLCTAAVDNFLTRFAQTGLGSLLYFSTSLQSKKVLGKSNEVQVKSTLLENYLSKK